MEYIVFDMEWNQGTPQTTVAKIPFEIVEIGAVRLNAALGVVDCFQVLVSPVVYDVIDYQIHKVMPLTMKELRRDGVPFPEAVQRFFEWCGEPGKYRFCTWGNSDITQLQRNMEYFELSFPLKTPVRYYDIQQWFDRSCTDNGTSRCTALEDAVAYFEIPCDEKFHRASDDARYTAAVMQKLDVNELKPYYSLDYYHNPQSKEDEIYAYYPDYSLYVSREFDDRDKLMKDAQIRSTRCCICRKNIHRKIRWYSSGRGVYRCLAKCEKHGMISGRIRLKTTQSHGVYAEKTMKMADEKEAEYIVERRNELRQRRCEKNRSVRRGRIK